MDKLVTATEEELAKTSSPSTARAVLAYALTQPKMVQEQRECKGIVLAQKMLQDSLNALKSKQRAKAPSLLYRPIWTASSRSRRRSTGLTDSSR